MIGKVVSPESPYFHHYERLVNLGLSPEVASTIALNLCYEPPAPERDSHQKAGHYVVPPESEMVPGRMTDPHGGLDPRVNPLSYRAKK